MDRVGAIGGVELDLPPRSTPPQAVLCATIVSDRAGLPIDGFDAQIASICRAHRAGLATRSSKDFRDTGIAVIDPWQAHPSAPTA